MIVTGSPACKTATGAGASGYGLLTLNDEAAPVGSSNAAPASSTKVAGRSEGLRRVTMPFAVDHAAQP